MGIVFGSTKGLEMPRHAVVHKGTTYVVRRYEPSVAVVASYGASGWMPKGRSDNEPFGSLAKYIGVFSKPQNTKAQDDKSEKIAMTAPVLIQPEKIAMTAPVLINPEPVSCSSSGSSGSSEQTMMFLLPASKYRTVEEVSASMRRVCEVDGGVG